MEFQKKRKVLSYIPFIMIKIDNRDISLLLTRVRMLLTCVGMLLTRVGMLLTRVGKFLTHVRMLLTRVGMLLTNLGMFLTSTVNSNPEFTLKYVLASFLTLVMNMYW